MQKPRLTKDDFSKLELDNQVTVAAFDPGETTGLCVIDHGECVRAEGIPLLTMLDYVAYPEVITDWHEVDVFVVERWTLYPGMQMKMINNSFIACQIIGMLQVLAHKWSVPIVMQSAAQAKNLVPNARLAHYPWKLTNDHHRDAARHAIYYLSERLRKGPSRYETDYNEMIEQRQAAGTFGNLDWPIT